MSTYVFMRVLESAPQRYDLGMAILTLGRLRKLKESIAQMVEEGDKVLDIGCGTGTLAILCAARGASVIGIDVSSQMLQIAQEKVERAGLWRRVELLEESAIELDTWSGDGSFDLVAGTLVMSELSQDERAFVLRECHRLLKIGGILAIGDEVLPGTFIGRLLFHLFRLPFVILTYLLAQTTTSAVVNLEGEMERAGFVIVGRKGYLLGTLKLLVARKE